MSTTKEHERTTAEHERTIDQLSRRSILKAGAATTSGLSLGGVASADRITAGGGGGDGGGSTNTPDEDADSPEGFDVEVLAPHATFPDDVAAKFTITYDEGEKGPIVSNLPHDASTVIFARVTWEPTGTSGWHTHPGPVVVAIADGELELVNERDCVTHTYTAGEAFIDPGQGNVHTATNPSDTESAVAYATFLGVPDGAPATVWVEPVDCDR